MSETVAESQTQRRLSAGKKARYLAEATGFFLIIGFFRLFGLDTASAIGGWLGRTFAAPSRLSALARKNLRAAFPEKEDAAIDTIVRGMWDNLGRVLAEYAHLDKIGCGASRPRIVVTGIEHFDAARARGRGVLLISGHLANWEVMPVVARHHNVPGAAVVRPTNNPYVNRWLEALRTRTGMPEVIAKGAAGMRRIFTLLRKDECICMLVDQRTSEGIPVPFFGLEALTTPAPAALALKLGAAVVPISNERTGGSHFHVRVHPPILPPDTGDADRDVAEYTAAITQFVETRVRAHPEQWLWIHRRWVDPGVALRNRRAQALSGRGGATSATSSGV